MDDVCLQKNGIVHNDERESGMDQYVIFFSKTLVVIIPVG